MSKPKDIKFTLKKRGMQQIITFERLEVAHGSIKKINTSLEPFG